MSINNSEFLGRGSSDDPHRLSDVDSAWFAQHHTLGPKANQASPGNHDHDGITSKVVKARWTSYTPSWLASTTNPTLGNGSIVGKYCKMGFLTFYRIRLGIGSTTTLGAGTNYYFTLPDDGLSDFYPTGQALLWDSSANTYTYYNARIRYPGTLDLPENLLGLQSAAGAYWNPGGPFILASNDHITVSGFYESAEA